MRRLRAAASHFRIYIMRNVRNRLFADSALYFVFINARYYRLIDRPECNQLSGEICVLYRDPISNIVMPRGVGPA
jgi:hypothetical protein